MFQELFSPGPDANFPIEVADLAISSEFELQPAAYILMKLGFLVSFAAMAAIDDGNHGNHIAVNEEESSFLRLEFLRCLQQHTAS